MLDYGDEGGMLDYAYDLEIENEIKHEVKNTIDSFINEIANRWEFRRDNIDTHSYLTEDIPNTIGNISIQMLIDELRSRI